MLIRSTACAALFAPCLALAAPPAGDCEGRETLRLQNAKIHTMAKKDEVVSSVLIGNRGGPIEPKSHCSYAPVIRHHRCQ